MTRPYSSPVDDDFSNVHLLRSEIRLLRKAQRLGSIPEDHSDPAFWNLLRGNFIHRNYTGERDSIGAFVPDDTYSLTNRYARYKAYRRHTFVRSSILPAVVSGAVSLIVSMICNAVSAL